MSDALLVVLLLAPTAAIGIAFAIEVDPAPLVRPALLSAAAVALVMLLTDATPRVGSWRPDQLALAAIVGTFVLAAAHTTKAEPVAPTLAASVAALGLALAPGDAPSPGAALLGGVAALVVLAPRGGGWWCAGAAVGLAIAASAAPLDGHGAVQVAVLTCGLAIAAGCVASRMARAAAVALPAVLVVGLRALPVVVASDRAHDVASVALGAAGLAMVALPFVVRRVRVQGSAPAVACWGLAAAVGAVPGVAAAAGLLGASAALAPALPVGFDAAVALPGAVALGDALLDARDAEAAVLGALAAATLAVIVLVRARPTRPSGAGLAAAGLGAWLLLRPSSWRWAGPPDMQAYTEAVAVALAAGLALVVPATIAAHRGIVPELPPPEPEPQPQPRPQRSWADRVRSAAAAGAMGCVAAALVRSGAL
jgi:hypothetical protein